MEKNSYERSAYESVDDGSPSWVISQKLTKTKFRQLRVNVLGISKTFQYFLDISLHEFPELDKHYLHKQEAERQHCCYIMSCNTKFRYTAFQDL